MRLIKENNVIFESFYRTVPNLDKTGKRRAEPVIALNHKNNLFFNELFLFHNLLNDVDDELTLTHLFQEFLRRIINFKEAGVLLFNEDQTGLIPVDKKISGYSLNYINNAYSEGILDGLYETSQHKIIPDFDVYYIESPKLNYLLYPIKSNKVKSGVLFVLTSLSKLQAGSTDDKCIKIILNAYIAKLDALRKEEQRIKAYEDIAQYQSKFMDNYKFAAIGELTSGISGDVLSSLQIIMSLIDMQEKEEIPLNKRDIISIKKHVNKVEQLIKGVVKFAGAGYEKTLMHPCNLNQILNDYYALINSTLKNKNMECVLDLASYMPNLLTDQGYINQLLVNVFEILGQSKIKSAGILIQTRYINEQINLKFLITEVIQEFENPGGRSSFNLRIINNLMKLHEGKFKAEVSPGSGTIIQFSFPVKRRLK